LDLIIAQNGAPTKLYRNRKATPGLRLRVEAAAQNPAGIGAVLTFPVLGGTVRREIQAGSGYWSMNGAIQVVHSKGPIEIRLPNGKQVTVTPPAEAKSAIISADATVRYE
jgi:hypothetical protein